MIKVCHRQPFIWSPVTVIDSQIIWYGVPVLDTAFVSEGNKISIRQWPVVKFDGEKTAETIIALLEMHKAQNTLPQIILTNNDGFSSFINNNNIKCNRCGSRMVLKKAKSYFLACAGYPGCKNTKLIEKSLVDVHGLDHFHELIFLTSLLYLITPIFPNLPQSQSP